MSFHSILASSSAAWIASAPISIAVLSNRPNGCRPTPMIATSFMADSSLSQWPEGERHNLVALVVGVQRDHGQLDVHSELEPGRVVLGEPALDGDHVVELDEAHPERDEVLTGRPGVGRPGRKALRGPRVERALPRQQQLAHAGGAAP